MKTAEECATRLRLWAKCDQDELREMLLAAYRQGCTDSMSVAIKWYANNCITHGATNGLGLQNDIWSLRDSKKLEEM